jgi:mercuric ion transport protein
MSGAVKRSLVALAGVGVSLLPKLACPMCWPAYAGLLSSIGLGFLLSAAYLLPLTVGFLALALAAMAFRARTRRGYGPLLLGLVAATGVLTGKFVWEGDAIMYGAVGLLVTASLWNLSPHRVTDSTCCTDNRRRKEC